MGLSVRACLLTRGGGLKKHNTHMMGQGTSTADSRVGSLDEVPFMRAESPKLVFG